MYKKIIVPLDGSELAECVLPHVESISKSEGSLEVILVIVVERFDKFLPINSAASEAGAAEFLPVVAFSDRPFTNKQLEIDPPLKTSVVTGKILKQGQHYLAKVAAGLANKGVKISIAVLIGEAAEEIVDFAGNEKADLIIMASHGRSGFRRWTMGSVAEKVFHGSSVPILLVKPAQV